MYIIFYGIKRTQKSNRFQFIVIRPKLAINHIFNAKLFAAIILRYVEEVQHCSTKIYPYVIRVCRLTVHMIGNNYGLMEVQWEVTELM